MSVKCHATGFCMAHDPFLLCNGFLFVRFRLCKAMDGVIEFPETLDDTEGDGTDALAAHTPIGNSFWRAL